MTGAEANAAVESVRASLATLKDVAGITGSFVCTHNGRLVAREIPLLFEDAVLAEAGSRLVRVGETFAAGGDDVETAVIRYGDHSLYLKSVSGGMLCILLAGEVNMPALRMAANLVARRIAPSVARAQLEPFPQPDGSGPSQAAPRSAVKATAFAPPGMRRFRGRSID